MRVTWREAFFGNEEVAEILQRMPHAGRIAFAAATAERGVVHIHDVELRTQFQKAIDSIWAGITTESPQPLRELADDLAALVPDEDAGSSHRAAMAVYYAMSAAINSADWRMALQAAHESFAALKQSLDLTAGKAVEIEVADELERGSDVLQSEIEFQEQALTLASKSGSVPTRSMFERPGDDNVN